MSAFPTDHKSSRPDLEWGYEIRSTDTFNVKMSISTHFTTQEEADTDEK